MANDYRSGYGDSLDLFGQDWNFYLVGMGLAVLGGLLGAFMSWFGILIGIIVMVATKFWDTEKTNRAYLFMFGATLAAGGIASLMFGAANSLSGTEMAESNSLSISLMSTPQKITDWAIDTLGLTKPALPSSVVNSVIAQSVGTSSTASTSSTTGTSGSLSY